MNEYLIEGKDYTVENFVLKIHEGVTNIPNNRFYRQEFFSKVIFPSSLVSIGADSFYACNLDEVIIPDSVKYICEGAFSCCSIKKITLGRDVTFIAGKAFAYNDIKSVINNSCNLKYISNEAFLNNENLECFDFNHCASYLNYNSFPAVTKYINNERTIAVPYIRNLDADCTSETTLNYSFHNGVLKIKDGVKVVGGFANYECKRIEMPDSVLFILPSAFASCSLLKSVRFSKNLIAIYSRAFYLCNHLNDDNEGFVKLPDNICEVNASAFVTGLDDLTVSVPMQTEIINLNETNDRLYVRRKEKLKETDFINKIDLSSLLEEEKTKLKELDLLPENIIQNRCTYNGLSDDLSNIIKESFEKFIMSDSYDENRLIQFTKKLLDLKEVDVSYMHNIIDLLFKRKQINTIYLLMSYGYDYACNCMISKAIIYDMTEMIDTLLTLGVNINETGSIIMTPLSIACQKGDLTLVKYLIEKDAAINLVDLNNKKAIDYAIENNFQDIVDLINSYDRDESEVEKDLRLIQLKFDN